MDDAERTLEQAQAALEQISRVIGLLRLKIAGQPNATHREMLLVQSAIYGLEGQRSLLSDLYRDMQMSTDGLLVKRWEAFIASYEDFSESARRHSLTVLENSGNQSTGLAPGSPD